MIQRISEKPKVEWYTKTASSAMKNGQALVWSSGQLVAASNSSLELAGISLRQVLTTDADYAKAVSIPVELCSQEDEFLIDVIAGGPAVAATHVGNKYDLASSGADQYGQTAAALGVDLGNTTYKQILITRVVSTTQVIGKITGLAANTPA